MRPRPVGHGVAAPFNGEMTYYPGMSFVLARITLNDLAPAMNQYNLDPIMRWADWCSGHSVGLVVQIVTRWWDTRTHVVPEWMREHEVTYLGARNQGLQLATWRRDAMGWLIDAHMRVLSIGGPILLGTASQESAVGNYPGSDDYDAMEFVEQRRRWAREVCLAFPDMRPFDYLNWIKDGQDMLVPLALDVAAHGAAIGNPDIMPGHQGLAQHVYPMFTEASSDHMTFSCVQPESYRNHSPEACLGWAIDHDLQCVIWNDWGGAQGIDQAAPLFLEGPRLPALPWPRTHPDVVKEIDYLAFRARSEASAAEAEAERLDDLARLARGG